MADIFISYQRDDRKWAVALSKLLEAQGWSTWWDRRINTGQSFEDVIEAELEKAKCVIVLWSEKSIKSRWVRAEAGEAIERNILIPVLIAKVRPPLAFRRIQTLDLTGWKGTANDKRLAKLIEDVQLLLGPPPAKTTVSERKPPYTQQKARPANKGTSTILKYAPWFMGLGSLAVLLIFLFWFLPESSSPAPPTASISASHKNIILGDSTQLRWSTKEAEHITLEPDIGEVNASGRMYVAPNQTTTYHLLATGAGRAIDSLEIIVQKNTAELSPPVSAPVATLAADRTVIERGTSTTLRWSTTGATSVRIAPGLGSVPLDGSRAVKPTRTTTYTLTATGTETSTRETVVIQVNDPKPPPVTDPCANKAGIAFKLIKAGRFEMGSNDGLNSEKPPHSVRLSKDFCLGVYEVTQEQWTSVMGSTIQQQRDKGNKDWYLSGVGPKHPMYYVSWEEVQNYLEKLNAQENCGNCYRLPTEAEWEYAARAGTTTDYSIEGDAAQLGNYAWYSGNANRKVHPVGGKRPNPWGLYDMHGNVWEWVEDWYARDYYEHSPSVDPLNNVPASYRVIRGGSWFDGAGFARSAFRNWVAPGNRNFSVGFRLVRTIP